MVFLQLVEYLGEVEKRTRKAVDLVADYHVDFVCPEIQVRFCPEMNNRLPMDSVTIVALLHDVCKAEVYKVVEKSLKGKDGQWEKSKAYGVDYSMFPLGHGEKSVIRLLRSGLEMTDDEIMAIRWHMSSFDLAFQSPESRQNYSVASDKCPLLAVLRAADNLASHILGV